MLSELMHAEYAQQNLRKPPSITRVTSVEAALEALRETKYDLLISLLRAQGESLNLESFVESVKSHDTKMPILLLALNPSELLSLDSRVDESLRFNVDKRLTWEQGGAALVAGGDKDAGDALKSAWLWPFLWQGNLSLFTAMFKAVEDRLNASEDIASGSPAILLVEDNVKFYSMYLPMVYAELIKQSAALGDESMPQAERINRMMSRPKASATPHRAIGPVDRLPCSARAAAAPSSPGAEPCRPARPPSVRPPPPRAALRLFRLLCRAGAALHQLRGGDGHLRAVQGPDDGDHHRRRLLARRLVDGRGGPRVCEARAREQARPRHCRPVVRAAHAGPGKSAADGAQIRAPSPLPQ